MQIAQTLDEGLNCKVGAAEMAGSIELEQSSGKSERWRKRSAGHDTLPNKCGWDTLVSLGQYYIYLIGS